MTSTPKGVDLHLLRCFDVLMYTRSVSRAAQQLNVSQPAMSRSLDRLRKAFADPLLVRSRHGMVPTVHANALHAKTREILSTVESLFDPSEDFDPRATDKTFVICATEYIVYALLPRVVHQLEAMGSSVSLDVRTPHRDHLFEWLESGEVDVMVGYILDPQPTLRSRLLFRDRLVCIARREHPRVRGSLTVDQYRQLGHARPGLVGGAMSEQLIDSATARLGFAPDIRLNVKNYLTIPFVVANSDLIATIPYKLAQGFAEQQQLQILEPPIELPEFRYALYWHERRQQEQPHSWLRKALAQSAQGLN